MLRLSKKAIDSMFLLIPVTLSRVKGIVFLPIIIAVVGLEKYGVFVLVMTNVTVLTALCHLAMGQSIVRYGSSIPEADRDAQADLFWTHCCSQ